MVHEHQVTMKYPIKKCGRALIARILKSGATPFVCRFSFPSEITYSAWVPCMHVLYMPKELIVTFLSNINTAIYLIVHSLIVNSHRELL